jgi:uncharacterized MAPEG superfamily protein
MFDSELSILAIYGLVVAISVALQTSGAIGQLGIPYLLSARDEGRSASGTTARLDRAQSNAVQAMALFAPAILILALKDGFSDATLLAAQVFLIARIVYLPAYAFGVTGLRTLTWIAGFLATISLYFLAL